MAVKPMQMWVSIPTSTNWRLPRAATASLSSGQPQQEKLIFSMGPGSIRPRQDRRRPSALHFGGFLSPGRRDDLQREEQTRTAAPLDPRLQSLLRKRVEYRWQ